MNIEEIIPYMIFIAWGIFVFKNTYDFNRSIEKNRAAMKLANKSLSSKKVKSTFKKKVYS